MWIHFFKGLVHNSIYNNTEFLQEEFFKFALFPVIQKVLKDNTHRIRKSLQNINEGRPAGPLDIHYFIKESSIEYLHEFNYGDKRLVKEERCADERNTYWVCSIECFELVSILTQENSLFEENSPEKTLVLLQKLCQLTLQF